jgi:uncharacterized membrane protein HdeD (DUF308 family)
MFHTVSKSLLVTGLLAIAMGVIAIVWPGITLAVVAAIFAVVAFITAVREFEQAFSSTTAGPVAGHVLLGLVDVAAGVAALTWPGLTVLVLTIWVAAWALVTGVGKFSMAFASGETAGERAMYGFGGLLSVALAVVLFARPDVGAVSLAQVFGLFSLAYGTWSVLLAVSAHSLGSRIDAALRPPARP